jgi:hypothetical protein
MGKLKDWVMGILAKRYLLGWLVKGYSLAEGKKTQLAAVLALLVWVGEVFGFIPKELAATLYTVIASIAPVTFLEKLKRYQGTAEKLADAVKEEAAKEVK